MPAPAVRVVGLRETIRTLERYGADTQDLKDAFGRITGLVQAKAEARVQRGATGKLAASIRPAKTKNKSVVRAGGARVPYAGVRHYGGQIPGSGYVQARLWLSNPARQVTPEAMRLIEQDLGRIAKRLGLNP